MDKVKQFALLGNIFNTILICIMCLIFKLIFFELQLRNIYSEMIITKTGNIFLMFGVLGIIGCTLGWIGYIEIGKANERQWIKIFLLLAITSIIPAMFLTAFLSLITAIFYFLVVINYNKKV
ncbi:hypothetical protein [Lactococcus sp.]|uniref:hypothetical protein n=1 Tax=Lactococcus sp. TaxID=44273 RepID=UPI0035B492A2